MTRVINTRVWLNFIAADNAAMMKAQMGMPQQQPGWILHMTWSCLYLNWMSTLFWSLYIWNAYDFGILAYFSGFITILLLYYYYYYIIIIIIIIIIILIASCNGK